MQFSVCQNQTIIHRFEAVNCVAAVATFRTLNITGPASLIGPLGYLVNLERPEDTDMLLRLASYHKF